MKWYPVPVSRGMSHQDMNPWLWTAFNTTKLFFLTIAECYLDTCSKLMNATASSIRTAMTIALHHCSPCSSMPLLKCIHKSLFTDSGHSEHIIGLMICFLFVELASLIFLYFWLLKILIAGIFQLEWCTYFKSSRNSYLPPLPECSLIIVLKRPTSMYLHPTCFQ